MACPDRYKDEKILAEIERRKKMQETIAVMERKYEYAVLTDVDLNELIGQIDIDRVEKIERTENGWMVTLNERRQ